MPDGNLLAGFGVTQSALLQLLLRNKRGLTIDQIAQGLGVTRTAVNQHLASLERDGHVLRNDVVATGGRPGRVYALSEKGIQLFPKNYDMFSLKTLEAMINALGADQTRKVLDQLGRDLGKELGASLKDKKPGERIPFITDVLQEIGFDAHIEENAPRNSPAIKAYNCVYHTLAQANPDVCRLDLAFLKEASGMTVEHVACMAKGDNECRFQFKKTKR